MSQPLLPERFRELEPFVATWSLATALERNRQSWTVPEQEMQVFYDAMVARLQEVFEYLNQYSLEAMPEEARRLFLLTLSLTEVSMVIESGRNKGPCKHFDPKRLVSFVNEQPRHRASTARKC